MTFATFQEESEMAIDEVRTATVENESGLDRLNSSVNTLHDLALNVTSNGDRIELLEKGEYSVTRSLLETLLDRKL